MVEGVIARAIETVIPAMSKESKVLHVVNSGSQSHGNNAEGGKRIKEIFPDSQNVTTLDGDTAAQELQTGKETFDVIVSEVDLASAARFTHDGMLRILGNCLAPRGKYIHCETFSDPQMDGSRNCRAKDDVELEILMAGFSVNKEDSGNNFVVAEKPDYDVSATSTLPVASDCKKQQDPKQVWAALAQDDFNNVDDELEDEDNLLDENEQLQSASKAAGGCETKPRACANCTCGRAAEEATADQRNLTKEELLQQSSSCGNCYKGDAFRCASCPFKGQPAFKPGMGEQVLLDLSADDTAGPIMTE